MNPKHEFLGIASALLALTITAEASAQRLFYEAHHIRRAETDATGSQIIRNVASTQSVRSVDIINDSVMGKRVYWIERSTPGVTCKIYSAKTDGSNLRTELSGLPNAWAARVDVCNRKIYWLDHANQKIMRANLNSSGAYSGGITPIVNVSGTNGMGLAVDPIAGKIYWPTTTAKKIWSANLNGSSPQVLVTDTTGWAMQGITLDGAGRIYWIRSGGGGNTATIMRADASTGGSHQIVQTGIHVMSRSLTIDRMEQKLFYARPSGLGASYGIYKCDLGGSDVEHLLTTFQCQAIGVLPPRSTGSTPDLYVADSYDDDGTEPSTVQYPWTSPSIWVRHNQDGGTTHQNPIGGGFNYVYVRVRNQSCLPSQAAVMKVHWAKASSGLGYPNPWSGTPNCSSGYPMGGQVCVTKALPAGHIPAGGYRDIPFCWPVPLPSNYTPCDSDETHFCLLARILTGMSSTEGSALGANVRNNNNICWRNLSVLGDDGGRYGVMMLSNYGRTTTKVRARFQLGRGLPTRLAAGQLMVLLKPAAMQAWLNGGRRAFGMQPSPVLQNAFDVLQDGAWLGGMTLAPNQHAHLELHVFDKLRATPGQRLVIHGLQQIEGARIDTIGGQEFVVPKGAVLGSARAIRYGKGCKGSNGKVPALTATATPRVPSARFGLEIRDGSPASMGLVYFGTTTGLVRLSGCELFVTSPFASMPMRLDAVGRGMVGFPIPNNPTLTGFEMQVQGLVIDQGGTLFGAGALTNAIKLEFGS